MNRFAAAASTFVVLVVVVTGLIIYGSPAEQRQEQLDQQRINDLRSLSGQIDAYWQRNGELPPELASLIDGTRVSTIPRDPNTDQAYEYLVDEERTFRLCTEFERQNEEVGSRSFWDHPIGRHCFSFTAAGDRQGQPAPLPRE